LGLLKALAEVRRRAPAARFRLVIAGSGPLLGALRRLAENLQLTGYVYFAGEARHERLPGIFGEADCFALSSYHEAQCMAELEAELTQQGTIDTISESDRNPPAYFSEWPGRRTED